MTSTELRERLRQLDLDLDAAKARTVELSDGLDLIAAEGSDARYRAASEALAQAEDRLDMLQRQKRGVLAAIVKAEADEREQARAEAQATVERARREAVAACRAWDEALMALRQAYGRLRDLHMQAAAAARLLGMTHGAFSIEGYSYLSGLRAATSEFPGGSPILGGTMLGRPADARPLAARLGLPSE